MENKEKKEQFRDYSIVLILNKNITTQQLTQMTGILQQNQFEYLIHKEHEEQQLYLRMNNAEKILQEAEYLRIEKMVFPEYIYWGLDQPNRELTAAERRYLTFMKSAENLETEKIKQLQKYRRFTIAKKERFIKVANNQNLDEYLALFNSFERMRITLSILKRIQIGNQLNFIHYYSKHCKLLDEIIPLHDQDFQVKRFEFMRDALFKDKYIDRVKNYFGENIAFYFVFLEKLQKWLIFPAILGLLTHFLNTYYHESVDTSHFASLYSLIIIFWMALFNYFYERKQIEQSIEWRSFGKSLERSEIIFTGEIEQRQTSQITGLQEEFYPKKKRLFRYFLSFIKALQILFVTNIILILSLNIRGYVYKDHIFYIDFLSQLAQEGAIFDKNSIRGNITTFAHVLILYHISMYYAGVSRKTSEQEYHKKQSQFEDSIITKRFIFEIFNTFLDLSYIAYINLDIIALRTELASIFTMDEFRRVFFETILPILQDKYLRKQQSVNFVERQIKFYEYEQFDDFLEVIINVQYICLYAAAFPLAPLLVLIFHSIEKYSDLYKITHCYRRPVPSKARGIGFWLKVLKYTQWVAVASNLILFAFGSEQIEDFLPSSWFVGEGQQGDNINALPKSGKGRYVMFFVFAIEHFIIGTIFAFKKVFNAVYPSWTVLWKKREQYKKTLKKFDK